MEQVNQQQQGDQTYYRKFACLFKSELYQDRHKNWMVKFRFDNNVIRFFYNFDKGVSRIDLNAITQCRSVSSIKLYLITNCWAVKGFTISKTAHIQQLMHGREDYYKTWSALDNKCLTFACKDLKRLYRNRIIDQYLTYKPFFLEEGEKVKHHLPEHITFTLHDRRTSGETAEGAEVSSELRGQRSKLKLRLQCNYDVSEKKAERLSQVIYDWRPGGLLPAKGLLHSQLQAFEQEDEHGWLYDHSHGRFL